MVPASIAQLPIPGNTEGGIRSIRRTTGYTSCRATANPGTIRPGTKPRSAECLTPVRDAAVAPGHRAIRDGERNLHLALDRQPLASLRAPAVPARRRIRQALGDAYGTFNPVLGQGVTCACLGSVLLGETIAEVDGDLDRLPAAFHPTLAARLRYPWQTAVGFDLRFPRNCGGAPRSESRVDRSFGESVDAIAQLAAPADVGVLETMLLRQPDI